MKYAEMLKLAAPVAVLGLVVAGAMAEQGKKEARKELKILLVAGGCCHDYPVQTGILEGGLEERLNANVEIHLNPDRSTEARYEIYEEADWAESYDLVIHDECSANVTDKEYIDRILAAHRAGVPAVNLHCAAHSFRFGNFKEPLEAGSDNSSWFEFQGIQSSGHGPKAPIEMTYDDPEHPIVKGTEPWTTLPEELYNNLTVFENVHPIISGKQMVKPKVKKGQKPDPKAKAKEAKAVIAWTNLYGEGKTRVFSMTLGHFNETVADDRYLDLVAKGSLWALDAINEDGTAKAGFGPATLQKTP